MISVESSTRKAFGVVYGVRLRGSEEYRYVGLTTKRPTVRLRRHLSNARSGRKTAFYDWLRKHAEEVVVDPLDTEWGSLESLGESEIIWIASLRDEGHRLLNIADGGLGPTGVEWTEEMREAARQRATGRKGVSRPGPLAPFYGRSHTAEQRAKWSEERKGTFVGPDNPNYGKFGKDHPSFGHTMSAESRAALSEMRKGERNPNFGKKASAETRAKMSAAQKGVPKPSSARSAHTRYHTNQGRFSPECRYCTEDAKSPEGT
ncbi:NUMOD3 domain-containing DNA-binding protein [Isoptericola variabilis]|uniref:NUMOD3 domain-containing DNA-binding protein n=1 Tax=Isoptericola variabilis TaxID=139208 RepID=UPI003D24DF68